MYVDDNELLSRFVNNNDQDAFEQIVRQHSNTVWRVCQGLMWQKQDSEDAFQATFLLLSIKANQLIKHQSLGGWLHVAAVRTCLKHRRQITQGREIELRHELQSHDPEPWQKISNACDRETLYREIARLPGNYREVIVLCCLDGKSRNDVAQILQRTSASVKAALARGKKLLRQRLLRNGIGCTIAITWTTSNAFAASQAIHVVEASISESLVQSTLQSCFNSNSGFAGNLSQLSMTKPNLLGVNFGTAKACVLVTSVVVLSIIGWFTSTSSSDQRPAWISLDRGPTAFIREVGISFPKANFQTRPQEDAENEDNFLGTQQALMERELALIKSELEIDDFLVHEIRKLLQGDLNQALERFRQSQEGEGSSNLIFGPSFDVQFEKDVWNRVGDKIPAQKKGSFDRYLASAIKLNQVRDSHYQSIVVQYLSDFLSLSLDQRFEIEALVAKTWKREWNLQASMHRSVFGTCDNIFSCLEDQLSALLSKEQLEAFGRVKEFNELPVFDMLTDPNSDGWNREELKSRCGTLLDLKISELDRLCDLTPEQRIKIRVAKNGAIKATAANWERVRQQLHGEELNIPADPIIRTNLLIPLTSPCLTVQCTNQREWRQAMKNVLNSEQLDRWTNRGNVRREAARDLMIGQIVNSIEGYSAGITYKQHQQLVLLLKNHIQEVRDGNQLEAAFHLSKIPDDEFAEILNDYQLSKILPTINVRRELAQFFSQE